MVGISGYVSIQFDQVEYSNLSTLDKLKHDLCLLETSGFSGPITNNNLYDIRKMQIINVKNRINNHIRKNKLNNLNILNVNI